MTEYPVKILVAFGEAVSDNDKIHRWLVENEYPELAALVSCLRRDRQAEEWLQRHNFQHFVAFHYAVYQDDDARMWLYKYRFKTLALLADAVNKDKRAVEIFRKKKLYVFIRLAYKIKKLKEQVLFDASDYHKMKF
ncbi:MAG: hypothetical protein R6U19_06735 [Bacteroidales bacterium]